MDRRKTNTLALLATGLMISLAACDGAQTETGDEEAPPPIVKQVSQPKMPPPRISAPGSQAKNAPLSIGEQVAQAKKNLASKLNVDNSEISEEAVRAVHWKSGALGCPRRGMSYTMAIQPGVLILLRVDGGLHRYHAGRDGMPFFCPADRAEAPAMGQGEEVM